LSVHGCSFLLSSFVVLPRCYLCQTSWTASNVASAYRPFASALASAAYNLSKHKASTYPYSSLQNITVAANMTVIWGLDLKDMQWGKFKSSYMFGNRDYHLRRTKFGIYQGAMILTVVSESLGTAALSGTFNHLLPNV
jgi:hypothetical protein